MKVAPNPIKKKTKTSRRQLGEGFEPAHTIFPVTNQNRPATPPITAIAGKAT
jgi:hypothetical protein